MAEKSNRTVKAKPEPAVEVASSLGVEAGDEWTPAEGNGKGATIAPGGPDEAQPDPRKLPDVQEQSIRTVLFGITGTADMAVGTKVGAKLTMTDGEIDQIAPPLTRIINRNAKLKAMAAQGELVDAVMLATGTIGYGVRVAGEAMETARQRRTEALENASAPDEVEL